MYLLSGHRQDACIHYNHMKKQATKDALKKKKNCSKNKGAARTTTAAAAQEATETVGQALVGLLLLNLETESTR